LFGAGVPGSTNHLPDCELYGGEGFFSKRYQAFGLDYNKTPASTLRCVQKQNSEAQMAEDKAATRACLKTGEEIFG